ncbi:MAG: hypothetical protein RML12_00820 [Xanthomonadales bacterium]|nr:hypothetical protein [Xanthomonadales bacterium]
MLKTPNGYELTSEAALAALARVLDPASAPAPGFHTPAQAFGPRFALGLPGVEWLAAWRP